MKFPNSVGCLFYKVIFRCGSADLVEALGANIMLDSPQLQKVFENCGFSFLFAPKFHPAMKAVVPVRKEIGVRTIFNILGPLVNPANPTHMLVRCFK